jgi:16S rRNA (guanine966-N2)-methyltransferase
MRVVAGRFRGRRLDAPEGRATRPILDRQKEALFNILQAAFPAAGVLDLFAGSGGLGIEALSRGAARAVFVESHHRALAALRGNLARLGLGADETRVLACDALALDAGHVGAPIDLVFCDPPFPLFRDRPDRLAAMLDTVGRTAAPGALLVLRGPEDEPAPSLSGWEAADERPMGESRFHFFSK